MHPKKQTGHRYHTGLVAVSLELVLPVNLDQFHLENEDRISRDLGWSATGPITERYQIIFSSATARLLKPTPTYLTAKAF